MVIFGLSDGPTQTSALRKQDYAYFFKAYRIASRVVFVLQVSTATVSSRCLGAHGTLSKKFISPAIICPAGL